jgi:hypothetical protein
VVNNDLTPPIMGQVTDDGVTTYKNTSLYAHWSAYEPESAVVEYRYAIGTSPTDPGSGYVVDWTSTGNSTAVNVTGLNLTFGQTYYFYVKAANSSNLWSDVAVSDGIKVLQDTTPPTIINVYDYDDVVYDNTRLSAYWNANEPESGIAEYQYAIGTNPTDPGVGYIVGWTSMGSYGTYVSLTGLNLTVDQTYYFYVKALNGVGLWSSVVASDGVKIMPPPTIGEAKLLPTDTKILLSDVVVSTPLMTYPNYCFYVQSQDRSAGIMIVTGNSYEPGTILDLSGNIYASNGEPYFSYPTITVKGTTTITPLGLNNASIGGSSAGLQEAIWGWIENGSSEYKLLPDSGLNNVGLLVKTTGKVTYIDPAGNFAYIDDGSHADDGNTLGPNGISIKGIKVLLRYGDQSYCKMSAVGSHVAVVGISGTEKINGKLLSVIRLRSQDDIMPISGAMISGKITYTATTNQLIESPHPCPDNYSDSWHIMGPTGAEKMRLHFTKIQSYYSGHQYGSLSYKAPGAEYPNWLDYDSVENIWTNWVWGNVIDINISGTAGLYGFQMDKLEAVVPVEGVEVTLLPGNIKATTDSKGYYVFQDLAPGTYTVVPSLDSALFNPSNQTIAIDSMQTVAGVDFIAY